jgi:5-methylcytosine-specific restriction endonuclease McrA
MREYPPTKRCSRCRRELPRSEFYKSKARPDGIQTVCKDCTKLNNRKWRDANPDAHLRHYACNPLTDEQREARRTRCERWQRENPERSNENNRRWVAANPAKARAVAVKRSATRKARQLGAFVEYVDPLVVLQRDCGVCGICLEPVDAQGFHIDHIVALARGGEHSYANVQIAHPTCNRRKGTRPQLAVPIVDPNSAPPAVTGR